MKLNKHRSIPAFIAGIAMSLAYAPFNIWFLAPILLAVLFLLLNQQTTKQQLRIAFSFCFAWFGAGISWVHVSIADYGGLPIFVSVLLMMLLAAYLALYPTFALMLSTRLQNKFNWQYLLLLLPIFALAEYLRGTLLTGFPWLSLGYTLTDSPLNSLAPYIGEFGLSCIVLVAAFALYKVIEKRIYISAMILSAIIVASLLVPQQIEQKEQQLDILLVQGNIKQELRWAPEHFWPTMSAYRDMTRKNWNVDLVVWPEAAVPEVESIASDYLSHMDAAASFNDTALITGIVDYQFDTKIIYNNLIVLGKQQKDDDSGHYQYLHKNRYRKSQLLPIGEFVPFENLLRPIAPLFDLPMSSFSRGERVQKNLVANGLNILPAICYEIAFADLVRDNYRTNSDILFTVSNDAWFGDSHGPHQHMQIARMRALELGLPLVRVTNNGISGVYNPFSDEARYLPQFEQTSGIFELPLLQGETFYAANGKTPLVILLTVLFALGLTYKGVRNLQQRQSTTLAKSQS